LLKTAGILYVWRVRSVDEREFISPPYDLDFPALETASNIEIAGQFSRFLIVLANCIVIASKE